MLQMHPEKWMLTECLGFALKFPRKNSWSPDYYTNQDWKMLIILG